MSMLSDFLKEQGISKEAVFSASRALEHHDVETRALMTQRAAARRAKKTYAELNLAKPSSRGRGLSMASIEKAIAGTPVPRLVRQKITRAVNAALRSAKKDPVEWRPLFADTKAKKGKKKK
jgi:hypothetical protein